MRIVHNWQEWTGHDSGRPVALVIGAFDGIHIGHQCLIRTAIEHARRTGGEAWLLTFDPHPSRVLRPDQAPPLLTSTAHKLRILESSGLDGVIVQPFTKELASLAPEPFFDTLRTALPTLAHIVVGVNWRFGRKAAGDITLLQQLAAQHAIATTIPEPVEWEHEPVSSTRIRMAVEAGRLMDAEFMLGRRFSLMGMVTTGKQYGRQLGFPTANIRLQEEARPPTGVYAVYAVYNGERHNGAAYLGLRPTAHGEHTHHLLEVHLFDVSLDLYGQDIEVFFVERLRGDQRFDSHETLKAQIAADVKRARSMFA